MTPMSQSPTSAACDEIPYVLEGCNIDPKHAADADSLLVEFTEHTWTLISANVSCLLAEAVRDLDPRVTHLPNRQETRLKLQAIPGLEEKMEATRRQLKSMSTTIA